MIMKNRMLKLLRILLVLALVTSCLWAITGCRKNAEAPDPDPNNQGSANDTEAYSGAGVNESSAPAPGGEGGKASQKLVVAVTIIPQQTFVKAVCGDLAEVVVTVPPGYSPENYEPSPLQMQKLSNAALYFSIGVAAEENGILSSFDSTKIVALHERVAEEYPERMLEPGERDPHIWLSPKRVQVMVDVIAQELGTLDPANQDVYRENARNYIAQLEALDLELKSILGKVKNKKFLVFHPAFGYLADDYGLEMYTLEEHGKEATPQHLQRMIDLARREQIKALFYQEEIDSSQSIAFAEEIGGRTIQLAPLAADYIENLQRMARLMAEVMQ
jgi:zinc transport system substrate-binding protein